MRLFFTGEVPCCTWQDIFISGEVLVLAFWSDPSNLWLDIFCSRYGFFSFVLSLISLAWRIHGDHDWGGLCYSDEF